MANNTNAEIIAIGTEILLGEITDTNSVFLARTLRDIGVNVYFMTSVGDNEQRIANAIRIALSRAQIIITCGGLGPTVDDMTRQGVAQATNRNLVFHQYLLDQIAERFVSFRAQMTENNRRQAYLPENAIAIENPVGTAPSFVVEHEGRSIISLPGVPREMTFLTKNWVIPYLREQFSLGGGIIKARVLRTAGIGESLLDSRIGNNLLEMSNPTVGLAAHAGQVDIRLTAKANSETIADEMIGVIETQIRERVGEFIFGVDHDTIEKVLVDLLNRDHMTVVTIEAGLGNPVSTRILNLPDGKNVLIHHEVHDDLKSFLGDENNNPLRETAENVAQNKCRHYDANACIVLMSKPDIDDEHADSEAGTAISVCTTTKTKSRVYGFGGKSSTAQEWGSTWALSILWQMLTGNEN
ncbi:MAG: CinA family nicotinamide mononucleotide deamidase-related protein [Anaerolineae bacterium]